MSSILDVPEHLFASFLRIQEILPAIISQRNEPTSNAIVTQIKLIEIGTFT